MVVSQQFGSEQEGYEFYNSYAESKGFSLRLDDKECMPGTDIVIRRRYVCYKEGYRLLKYFEETDRKREPRPLTRCGCEAMIEIKLKKETGIWFVNKFIDEHNHRLASPEDIAFLQSHRWLTDAQKAEVIEYGVGGLRPYQIMEVLEKHHGSYKDVGFVSRDLYNFFARYKKKRILGRDALFLLNHMRAQAERDAEFFFKYTKDDDGCLKNIFWADSQSRIDYDAFGGVLVFDSTYRVNRYNLPFVPFVGVNHHRSTTVFGVGIVSDETVPTYQWLLETFLEAMRHKHPKSVITDGDSAMRKAIRKVMPETYHRLCSWHTEQNMVRHLRGPMLSEFRKFIYYPMEEYEFELSWAEFKAKHNITDKNVWMAKMYKLRKRWSAAYTKGKYFLGMLSNQRSESLNSRLHRHLDRKMSLVDLLEHYEHCLSRIRRNEAELDAKASNAVPFTRMVAHPLEKNAAHIYTPKMFKKVRDCIWKSYTWNIGAVTEEDGLFSYSVQLKGHGHRHVVRYIFDGSELDGASCDCRKMEREDIPCAHIFSVLKHHGFVTISPSLVMTRWTMQAKAAFVSERNANTHVWSEQIERYRHLRNKASAALFKASKSSEVSERVMDFLGSIVDGPIDEDRNTEATTFGPLPAHFSCCSQENGEKILDPKKIVPKGAPCKERLKPYQEKFGKKNMEGKRIRTCSYCGSTTHDRKTCPNRK